MAVSALGISGWAVLTTKLVLHSCQQNGQGKAASARCCMLSRPQELEADVGSADVLGLTFLKAQGELLDKALQGSKTIPLLQAVASVG